VDCGDVALLQCWWFLTGCAAPHTIAQMFCVVLFDMSSEDLLLDGFAAPDAFWLVEQLALV
jgi:hypothetical protein